MSTPGRVESGAQLLARLGPRPSIRGVGTSLFGFEPSPGSILELYGGEGVGKSELLLNLVTSFIVSPATTRHNAQGSKAQVMWVDCDLKFSILRLAILLEHRLLNASAEHCECLGEENLEKDKGGSEPGNKTSGDSTEGATTLEGRIVHKPVQGEKTASGLGNAGVDCTKEKPNAPVPDVSVKLSGEDPSRSFKGPKQAADQEEDVRPGFELTNRTNAIQSTEPNDTRRGEERENASSGPGELSEEEVEKRVQEGLENILVARVTSSQQLICTLCSLEASIAANPSVVALIIDPISAFFWTDRCRDDRPPSSGSILYKSMSYVATILKRIAQSYGLLVVVTKQALVSARPKATLTDNVLPSAKRVQAQSRENHVEFLGKAWSDAVTHRIVCTKHEEYDGKGESTTHFSLTSGSGTKRYTITEGGLCFDH